MSMPPRPAASSASAFHASLHLPCPPPAMPIRMGSWSESSWDLACGLTVREGLPADASLVEWLGAAVLGA